MNKSQKSHAGEYVKLLSRAHDEIRKAAEVKKYDIVRDLLEQCQEAALELGNMIEAVEGEGVPTIPLLESYCELTYQLHEEIWENHVISPGKVYKSLRKSLVLVENSVKHDIPLRTEAVFLPYKASMWDSLESVWKAADEDPDCDAYVIPIPYYDKNPDGSFREMHYEGNDYPDYVPVTWYEDYDFAERQPDMIFIHNPYDECNFVTSVHPFFYSKNLKQFTEKLVYIPYFILGEVDPNNKQAVDGVAHFCTCPGVINADKVIVQSEAMRQVYIHVMSDFAGEDTRKYWEKKILGLGSPKVDKVMSTRKEDLEVPKEWLKIIEKPDGSWKKIIFYNTSVTALLQNNEKMLQKMEDVFRVFKENQAEVALLWRPHPLIKATIESMRPELWKAYEKIVEKYCMEGWGIYDDSVKLERAIEVSDAYYGDPSSVVRLFQEVGKDILIQNLDFTNVIEQQIVSAEAISEAEDGYCFVPVYGRTLFKMNKYTYEIDVVAHLDEEREAALYLGVFEYREKLFLLPKTAEKIAVYDKNNQDVHYIEFRDGEKAHPSNSSFLSFHVQENKVFLIPQCYDSIVQIDMETERIEKARIPKWIEGDRVCVGNSAILGQKIYIPCFSHKYILIYDIQNFKWEYKIPNEESLAYTHIFEKDGKLWLLPYDIEKEIRIWNTEENRFEDTIPFPVQVLNQKREGRVGFGKSLNDEERVFLLATGGEYNVTVHMETKKIDIWSIKPHYNEHAESVWYQNLRQLAFLKTQEHVYIISGMTGEWFQYQEDTWEDLKAKSQVKNFEAISLDNRFMFFGNSLWGEKMENSCAQQIYKTIGYEK